MKLAQQQRTLGSGKQAAALQQVSQAARPAAAYAAQSRRALLLPWLAYNYSPKAIDTNQGSKPLTQSSQHEYQVFPNPSKELLHIQSRHLPIKTLELWSIDGKKQLQKNYTEAVSEQTLSVSALQNGVYILKIYAEEDNVCQTIKVIIQK